MRNNNENDSNIMLDLFDLTGEHEPVSIATLIEVNEDCPIEHTELRAMRELRVGQSVMVGIGGGAVAVKRVA